MTGHPLVGRSVNAATALRTRFQGGAYSRYQPRRLKRIIQLRWLSLLEAFEITVRPCACLLCHLDLDAFLDTVF